MPHLEDGHQHDAHDDVLHTEERDYEAEREIHNARINARVNGESPPTVETVIQLSDGSRVFMHSSMQDFVNMLAVTHNPFIEADEGGFFHRDHIVRMYQRDPDPKEATHDAPAD